MELLYPTLAFNELELFWKKKKLICDPFPALPYPSCPHLGSSRFILWPIQFLVTDPSTTFWEVSLLAGGVRWPACGGGQRRRRTHPAGAAGDGEGDGRARALHAKPTARTSRFFVVACLCLSLGGEAFLLVSQPSGSPNGMVPYATYMVRHA